MQTAMEILERRLADYKRAAEAEQHASQAAIYWHKYYAIEDALNALKAAGFR